VRINAATVVQADVPARNGMIHVIDSVLIPADGAAPAAGAARIDRDPDRGPVDDADCDEAGRDLRRCPD
jgi:hypothetical protein